MMTPKEKWDKLEAIEQKAIEKIEKAIDEPMDVEVLADITKSISHLKKSHLQSMNHTLDAKSKI